MIPIEIDKPDSAGFEYGRRWISWRITEPGALFRNEFKQATITVSERGFFNSDLYVSAERRVDGYQFVPFTDAARERISERVLVALDGWFDSVWDEAFGVRMEATTGHLKGLASEARKVADWWADAARLTEMFNELQIVPVEGNVRGSKLVRGFEGHSTLSKTFSVIANLYLGDRHVGYLTEDGVLPLETEVDI